jgi:hypothetical protein
MGAGEKREREGRKKTKEREKKERKKTNQRGQLSLCNSVCENSSNSSISQQPK